MQLTGRVHSIYYRQPTPLTTTLTMTALTLEELDGDRQARCVGAAPLLQRGAIVTLDGQWETHPRYGRQFRFTEGRVLPPTSLTEVYHTLAGPLFAGLGPGRVQSLRTHLGPQLLALLAGSSTPTGATAAKQALETVPGFGPRLISQLVTTWAATYPIFEAPTATPLTSQPPTILTQSSQTQSSSPSDLLVPSRV